MVLELMGHQKFCAITRDDGFPFMNDWSAAEASYLFARLQYGMLRLSIKFKELFKNI
jgi:hypothetical protein